MSTPLPRGSLSPFGRAPSIQKPLYRIPLHYTQGLKSKGFGLGNGDRMSTGWYFDPTTGNLEYATATLARIEAKGLLVEPAAENICLRNKALTTSPWVNNNCTRTQNVVGIDGLDNSGWTLTDDAIDEQQNVYQTIAIPNDSNTNILSIFVKKAQAPRNAYYPAIQINQYGGTPTYAVVHLDEYTGAIADDSAYPPDYKGIQDYGDWWRIWIGNTNNSSGNDTANCIIRPAYTGTFGGTAEVGVTGSSIMDMPQFELNTTFPTSVIHTMAVAVTRETDAEYEWPIPAGVSVLLADSGTMTCLWTPQFDSADYTGENGILSTTPSLYSLMQMRNGEARVYCSDQTTPVAGPALAWLKNETIPIAIRWGFDDGGIKYEIGWKRGRSDWTWGTAVAFDGDMLDSGTLYIGYGLAFPFHIKNIYFYDLMTQAQIEAMI